MRVWLIDEPQARARLESIVTALQEDWTIILCEEGDEVVEAARDRAFDAVICSDRTQPYLGTELLAKVQNLHPEALRVLAVPEHTEPNAAAKLGALPQVQQLIAHPFSEVDVRTIIRRLTTVHGLLADRELRAKLGSLQQLPSSPAIFLALRSTIADDNASMHDIVDRLNRAPALVARVLRLSNSALFSRGRPITDLHVAVQRLGLDVLAQLVLSSEVFGHLGRDNPLATALEQRALIASRLATKMMAGTSQAGLASSAALLSDIGMLLPNELLLEPISEVSRNTEIPRSDLLGACLLGLWGLPMPIVEAVAYRRKPARIAPHQFELVSAVHIAAGLAAGEDIDENYIAGFGMATKLREWKTLAAALHEELG